MHDDLKQRLRQEVDAELGSRPASDLSDVLTRGRSKRLALRLVTAASIVLIGTALVAGGSWVAGVRSLSDDAGPITPADESDDGGLSAVTYDLLGVEVSLHVSEPWAAYSAPAGSEVPFPGEGAGGPVLALDKNPREHLGLDADPYPAGRACQPTAGHTQAEALAREIRSRDDLEATAPVAVTVGGVDALRMDVTAAPGARPCSKWGPAFPAAPMVLAQSISSAGATLEEGSRMRLYLLDTPWRGENWSRRVFALWIVAPETRFEDVAKAAQPILDSIEFRAP